MKTQTEKINWYGWRAVILIILGAIFIALVMNSCTSKSGQIMTKYEKCIVMDTSYPNYYILNYNEGYKYRVQRIEYQNVITTLYNPNIWHTGDTILLRFSQIVNEN